MRCTPARFLPATGCSALEFDIYPYFSAPCPPSYPSRYFQYLWFGVRAFHFEFVFRAFFGAFFPRVFPFMWTFWKRLWKRRLFEEMREVETDNTVIWPSWCYNTGIHSYLHFHLQEVTGSSVPRWLSQKSVQTYNRCRKNPYRLKKFTTFFRHGYQITGFCKYYWNWDLNLEFQISEKT